jgi:DNA modification methylase
MTPYYSDDAVTIYHGDCREIVPTIAADCVVTDPPYAINLEYSGKFMDDAIYLGELTKGVLAQLIASTERVVITPGVGNMYRYPEPKWVLCWFEAAGNGSGPWGFCTWQPVLVYGKDPYLQDGKGRRPDGRIFTSHVRSVDTGDHPCPKPYDVMTWLVERTTRQADTILDPFMGSGTTLRAAKDLGRKAIGIEIEERYCEIAVKRLAQEVLAL